METMDKAIQTALAGPYVHYQRTRRPEEITLYRLVQERAQTFLVQAERGTEVGLPEFVKDEFEAFLECSTLARGFFAFAARTSITKSLWPCPGSGADFTTSVASGAW